jgi:predicted pyridoxine 5'-phosphate oxidase superfamily flavin-nucleotide-binding protein
MAAINIQSLFADIIDTPEQRQQKLLQQGMLQGQLLSSGLRGRAAALAPLAQIGGQLGVQRNDALRRAVQPMIGIDPRSTGERVSEQLQGLNPNNANSILQAAQALQSIDPVRAASLRQMAAQLTRQNQADMMAQQQASTSIAKDLEAITASQEGREASRKAAQNENLTNAARVNSAASVVREQDPNFAALMPVMYFGDPDGAAAVAEKYLSGASEGSIRNEKINSYTNILFGNGEFDTVEEAREYATKVADNKIQITPDPNNPTRATFTDLLSREVRVISSLPSVDKPLESAEDYDAYLEGLDDISVSEMLSETTGLGQMTSEIFGRIAEGMTGVPGLTDKKRTQYKQGLKQVQSLAIRAFSINPKYIGTEQERIIENLSFDPEILLGKEGAAAKVAAVDKFLDDELVTIQNRMNDPEVDSGQKAEDLKTKSSIIAFKERLYPKKININSLNSDVVQKMSKARLLFTLDSFTDQEKDTISPELERLITQKLTN